MRTPAGDGHLEAVEVECEQLSQGRAGKRIQRLWSGGWTGPEGRWGWLGWGSGELRLVFSLARREREVCGMGM